MLKNKSLFLYYFLISAYFFAVIATSVGSLLNINIQDFYRIPIIKIKIIDIAIIFILISFTSKIIRTKIQINKINKILGLFIILFVFFTLINLLLTFGKIEFDAQIGFLLALLCVVIFYDFQQNLDIKKLSRFVTFIVIASAFSLLIYNFNLLAGLYTGTGIAIEKTGGGERLLFINIGMKETIGTLPLISIVLFGTLNFSDLKIKYKNFYFIIMIISTLSLFISLIFSFHRGMLFTILLTFLYDLFFYKGKFKSQIFVKIAIVSFLFLIVIYIFENILYLKGFKPIQNLIDTFYYAIDIENPEWDKGRSISRALALQVWSNNLLIGIGLVYLDKYTGMYQLATAHNFFITSLLHNGIIGTFLYVSIFLVVYYCLYKLFKVRNQLKIYNLSFIANLIIISGITWLIPFLVQEVIFERYSLSFQYVILSISIFLYNFIKTSNKP